jgi:hypothetical protein
MKQCPYRPWTYKSSESNLLKILSHDSLLQSPYKTFCRGHVPWVPRAAGYNPNKSGYSVIPSSGKRLGNQVHHTESGPTSHG